MNTARTGLSGTRHDPRKILASYALKTQPSIFAVGTFDTGITVLRQQIRSLNLAWALIETGKLGSLGDAKKVAIIGAGFAGLTLAAAIVRKQPNCKVFVFEEHDTLLPLQQGSDTRWLHPRIYDWPDEGSDADVAMLPVLNWSAARASDVAVQVLQDWRRTVAAADLRLFCNTRHLQISADLEDPDLARVEWVAEEREPCDGTSFPGNDSSQGCADHFDAVVLATGFGIEDGKPSYWRNETLGQPNLYQRRRTHLVSGQGDGALIDLLRVRVSQFRQDRILEEMFSGKNDLVAQLRLIKDEAERSGDAFDLFGKFDAIFGEGHPASGDARDVLNRLARRLRRDTDAVLQLRVREISDLLKPKTSRTSFQNSLLVYLLYRVGGFAPSAENEAFLKERFSISDEYIVHRHGTQRLSLLKKVLSDSLFSLVEKKIDKDKSFGKQVATMLWPGGYFGFPGKSDEIVKLGDEILRSSWRKEYLPGATTMLATSICGAVVGRLRELRPHLRHLRVTLHRVLPLHEEVLLQQVCGYQGAGIPDSASTAGRTFPATNAMIGLAWRCHRPVQTRPGANEDRVRAVMAGLNLHDAARAMLPDVSYVLAMPVLQNHPDYFPPSRVAGVLYLDSKDDDFALGADEIMAIRSIADAALSGVIATGGHQFRGLRNFPFHRPTNLVIQAEAPPVDVQDVIEFLDETFAPSTAHPFLFNFDLYDPASVETLP